MSTPRGRFAAEREDAKRRPPVKPQSDHLRRRPRIMSDRHRVQLFKEFVEWGWNYKRWSPKTQETYYQRARAANLWLEENRGTSILWAKPKDLQAYLFTTRPDARVRNQVRCALVAFGKFLVDRGDAEINPALALPILPVKRVIPEVLDREQIRRVLSVARTLGGRTDALITTLAYTGIRREEVRTLEWSSFEPRLTSDDVWVRFIAKGSKERMIPLHDKAREALLRWREDCTDPRWVFPSDKKPGRPVAASTIATWVDEVGGAAGVDLYPHIFRHTFATAEIDSGVHLREVQEWLGHASSTTTAMYTHVHPSNLRDAMKKLDFGNLPGGGEEDKPVRAIVDSEG